MRNRLLMALALGMASHAGMTDEADSTDALRKTLEVRYPTVRIESIYPSAIPGLFEVATADRLVYADAAGNHLIIGQVMDTRTRENLTEKRWNDLNRIDFNSLPFEHAIKIVKGDGSRQLAAFEDPLCPYCAELEKALEALNNYTLYVFLLPLENLHPGATSLARSIWCADDPGATWSAWMQRDARPESRSCDTVPGEQISVLATKHKIASTPTLFFADGLKVPGALSAEAMEKYWTQIKQQIKQQ